VTYRQVGVASREIGLGLWRSGCREGTALRSSRRRAWNGALRTSAPSSAVRHGADLPSNLPDQVEYILAHSRARAVFAEDELQYNKVAGVRSRLPHLSSIVMMTGGARGRRVLRPCPRCARSEGARFRESRGLEARAEEILPTDDLTIIYTSGTTGPRKGRDATQQLRLQRDLGAGSGQRSPGVDVPPVLLWRTLSGAWSTSSPSTRWRSPPSPLPADGRGGPRRGPSGNHGERARPLREVLRRVLAKVEEDGG